MGALTQASYLRRAPKPLGRDVAHAAGYSVVVNSQADTQDPGGPTLTSLHAACRLALQALTAAPGGATGHAYVNVYQRFPQDVHAPWRYRKAVAGYTRLTSGTVLTTNGPSHLLLQET